jgi:hypothetical protein
MGGAAFRGLGVSVELVDGVGGMAGFAAWSDFERLLRPCGRNSVSVFVFPCGRALGT